MTAQDYRAKWGLAADYPLVAHPYARKRQALAKQIGLGRKPEVVQPERAPAPTPKAKRSRA